VVAAGLLLAAGGVAGGGTIKRPPAAPGTSSVDRDPLPDFGLGIDGEFNAEGILFTRTPPAGSAALAGLEPGDVLLAVNGTRIRTPEDWVRVMTDNSGRFNLRFRNVRTGAVEERNVDLRQ
jgi:S1-C subfamily serine protease